MVIQHLVELVLNSIPETFLAFLRHQRDHKDTYVLVVSFEHLMLSRIRQSLNLIWRMRENLDTIIETDDNSGNLFGLIQLHGVAWTMI